MIYASEAIPGSTAQYPFIARQGCSILPSCQRLRIRKEGASSIRRYVVHHAGGNLFAGHCFSLMYGPPFAARSSMLGSTIPLGAIAARMALYDFQNHCAILMHRSGF